MLDVITFPAGRIPSENHFLFISRGEMPCKHQHISEMTSNYNWEESINLLEYERFFWSKVLESRMCKHLQGVNISLS